MTFFKLFGRILVWEGIMMEKYRDMSIRKKSNLKMMRNIIFFILLIIFTFWFIFKDQNIHELVRVIRSVNLTYVFIGIFYSQKKQHTRCFAPNDDFSTREHLCTIRDSAKVRISAPKYVVSQQKRNCVRAVKFHCWWSGIMPYTLAADSAADRYIT